MAVTVPSTDVQNFSLQAAVTALQAAVTANANPAIEAQLTAMLNIAQVQLVDSLMANANARHPVQFGNGPSFLTAANILANGTINT
jgi:hypothetical protein